MDTITRAKLDVWLPEKGFENLDKFVDEHELLVDLLKQQEEAEYDLAIKKWESKVTAERARRGKDLRGVGRADTGFEKKKEVPAPDPRRHCPTCLAIHKMMLLHDK